MPWPVVDLAFLNFELLTFSDVDGEDFNPLSTWGACSVGKSRTTFDDSESPLRSGDAIWDHDL